MHMVQCHLENVSLRVGLQCGDLVLRDLKLEEELDVLGDVELVADVERSRLHLCGFFVTRRSQASVPKRKTTCSQQDAFLVGYYHAPATLVGCNLFSFLAVQDSSIGDIVTD